MSSVFVLNAATMLFETMMVGRRLSGHICPSAANHRNAAYLASNGSLSKF
jgi:hypothetical protein